MRLEIPMLSQPWPTGEPVIAWHDQIQPVPLHRPQTVQHGRNQRGARTILHPDDVYYRSELQIRWMQAHLAREPIEGPIALVCEFSGRTTNRWGKRAPRPDLSNLLKAVEDAGNGVLWEDDRQVMQLAGAIRRWDRDAQPLVALWLWELTAWPDLGEPGRPAMRAAAQSPDPAFRQGSIARPPRASSPLADWPVRSEVVA